MTKQMTHNEKISEMGLTGEKIIINLLSAEGLKIEQSINKFDSTKDMMVEGKTVEVKTETPYVMKKCFSFRPNQLNKCRSVDVLYIVSVPHVRYKSEADGWIYRLIPTEFKHFDYTTSYGIKMIGIPWDQPAVIPVKKMTDEEISELTKYSNTAYT